MTTAGIVTERDGAVLHLSLDRPEARNALTGRMYDTLREALQAAATDPEIAVVLLSGTGGTFCAGNDISGLSVVRTLPKEERPGYRFMRALLDFPKPVVAAVTGNVVGIGVTMLLHCDLIYAGEGARFRMPFAQLGLVPEFASSFLLPRMSGHARAAEWLLLGEAFGAREAFDIGLATAVVPDDAAIVRAHGAAARLAALPAEAVQLSKKLMRAPVAERLATILDIEMELLGERMASAETQALIAQAVKPGERNRRA